MSTVKYFSGTSEVTFAGSMRNAQFAAMFPGATAKRYDGFSRYVGKDELGNLLPINRVIFRKSSPSNHKCDARCRNAKGGNCECSCGGKYHGAGHA